MQSDPAKQLQPAAKLARFLYAICIRLVRHPEVLWRQWRGRCSGGRLHDTRSVGCTGLEFGESCRGKIGHRLISGGGQASEEPMPCRENGMIFSPKAPFTRP